MHCHFPVSYNGTGFKFNQWLGLVLFSTNGFNYRKPEIPMHKAPAFECVSNPYRLKKPVMIKREPPKASFLLKIYAKTLTFLYKKCYPLANLIFGNLRLNVFENGEDANWYYRSISYGYNQNTLCLPRAAFIASTSKKFKESGVMFIGIFPPMRNLHAWVIEGDAICDICEIIWTSYQPLYARY